jgi:hypothetical protein
LNAEPLAATLRRVGWALIALGVLDIAVWLYGLAHGFPYATAFNVFAVAAGVLMLRGSVTATALVRWSVAFTLASILALALVVLLLFPLDLWRTVYRLYPGWSAAALVALVALLLLLAWMARELEREPVRALLAAAGKGWGLRGAWASGAGMMLLVGGLFALLLNGGLAAEATTRARAQAGPGYRYQVLILVASLESRGIEVMGSVIAWNEREIRIVPVRWGS